jgi:hypothetical protein
VSVAQYHNLYEFMYEVHECSLPRPSPNQECLAPFGELSSTCEWQWSAAYDNLYNIRQPFLIRLTDYVVFRKCAFCDTFHNCTLLHSYNFHFSTLGAVLPACSRHLQPPSDPRRLILLQPSNHRNTATITHQTDSHLLVPRRSR